MPQKPAESPRRPSPPRSPAPTRLQCLERCRAHSSVPAYRCVVPDHWCCRHTKHACKNCTHACIHMHARQPHASLSPPPPPCPPAPGCCAHKDAGGCSPGGQQVSLQWGPWVSSGGRWSWVSSGGRGSWVSSGGRGSWVSSGGRELVMGARGIYSTQSYTHIQYPIRVWHTALCVPGDIQLGCSTQSYPIRVWNTHTHTHPPYPIRMWHTVISN